LAEEDLDASPRVLNIVGVGPGVRSDKLDAVLDSSMRVTLRTEIAVRTPAITDDRSAGFDPVTNYSHQRVGGSVLNGNKECFPGLSFHTAKHPLTLYRVSPMIFSPTEIALVNFDGLIRTTDLNAAALQKHENDFPAKHAPVCGYIVSQVTFTSYFVGWFAIHDVIRDE
jgi:hypothetical protein